MDESNAGKEFSRSPTLDDLVELCRNLNAAGAAYDRSEISGTNIKIEKT